MKTLTRILSVLLVFSMLPAFSLAETPGSADALKAKHEPFVLEAMAAMASFAMDDYSISRLRKLFLQGSSAWKCFEAFDGGWFPTNVSHEITNLRTDGWEQLSDTEIAVNAYCDCVVKYVHNHPAVTHPCAYRFTLTQTDARNDTWMVTDFTMVLDPADEAHAAKFTKMNEGIALYPVVGKTYSGFMMVIDDPSRVFLGSIKYFGNNNGKQIDALCEQYDAIGGINGGGFSEANGGAGKPIVIVYSMGEKKQSHNPSSALVGVLIGFDKNDKLIVGQYERQEADQLNLRDAVGFGPALIIDGAPQTFTKKKEHELTTRTAIGQDAYGCVLMLVIRGRLPGSLGANMDDLTEIMLKYGAVNAGNLDGGNSTTMFMNGEEVYSGYRLECSRSLPNCFLIKKSAE